MSCDSGLARVIHSGGSEHMSGFSGVDYVQIINGVAASIAAGIWLSVLPRSFRLRLPLTALLTSACFGLCLWYAIVNFMLGLGFFSTVEERSVVPPLRLMFPFLVLAPALRTLTHRRIGQILETQWRG